MLVSTLLELSQKGVNMVVDAKVLMSSTLESLAMNCAKSGGTLYLKNADALFVSVLQRLATIGKNHVTFDFA